MARILIAEDDPHISRVVTLWLQRNGHQVDTVLSGDKALALLRAEPIELLITDVNMPGMNGLELVEAASAESLLSHPVIVLTSRCDQSEIAARVGELRAVVHPKPFSPMQLMKTVDEALVASLPASGEADAVVVPPIEN